MNPLRYQGVLVVCLLAAATPGALSADTIVLKDGQTYSGIIISVSKGVVIIRIDTGAQPQIEKKRIRRIEYSESEAERKKKQELAESIRRQQEELQERGRKIARIQNEKRAEDTNQARLASIQAEKDRQAEEQKKLAALETEKKRQEEQAAARKDTVKTLQSEIATLLKEEESLKKQEEAIQKRRDEIQKRKEELSPGFDPWFRIKRSAMVPGWGQVTADRYPAGGLFAFAFLATAVRVQSSYRDFRGGGQDGVAGRALLSSGALQRNLSLVAAGSQLAARSTTDQRKSATALAFWSYAIGGIYLWNLADAFLFGPDPAAQLDGQRTTIAIFFAPGWPDPAGPKNDRGQGSVSTLVFALRIPL